MDGGEQKDYIENNENKNNEMKLIWKKKNFGQLHMYYSLSFLIKFNYVIILANTKYRIMLCFRLISKCSYFAAKSLLAQLTFFMFSVCSIPYKSIKELNLSFILNMLYLLVKTV